LPQAPIRPRKALNLAAGILLGLFLGLGTVFFIDYLDNTIKSSEDVERFLNLPLLAMVPKYQKEHAATDNEAFQTLRTSILFASKGRSLKTLLVTSAGPGEGKSRTIVALAKTLALAGDNVVLMDCDLRRPTIHAHLDLSRSNGLTNYLLAGDDGEPVTSYMKNVPGVDKLRVLTCGPLPPNPVEMFGSPRFVELVQQVRQQFDWLLIDSPPLASLSDSVVLGAMADITVLVIKHNHNDKEMIRRSTEQLQKVNANIAGVVMNAIDLKRAGYHDYYYAAYEYQPREDAKRRTTKRKLRRSANERT
jgi:capsular exopolysaccharide synthesis family protein